MQSVSSKSFRMVLLLLMKFSIPNALFALPVPSRSELCITSMTERHIVKRTTKCFIALAAHLASNLFKTIVADLTRNHIINTALFAHTVASNFATRSLACTTVNSTALLTTIIFVRLAIELLLIRTLQSFWEENTTKLA